MQKCIAISAGLQYIMFADEEIWPVGPCGANNFPQDMVYGGAFHHTIYGVSVMQSNSAKERLPGYGCRSGNVLLLMFLTGIVLGCAATQLLGLRIRLPAEAGAQYGLLDSGFLIVLLRNAKFLLCVFLLAFSPAGPLLLPPLFGMEGMLLGACAGAVFAAQGANGLGVLGCRLLFRLLLVVPYGFLLGDWALRHGLRFPSGEGRYAGGVLAVTAVLLLGATVLECTLSHLLGAAYYLRFGV